MGTCEICGNSYDEAFTLPTHERETHTFDSFECAIQGVAPTCEHCGCPDCGTRHGVRWRHVLLRALRRGSRGDGSRGPRGLIPRPN